MVLEDQTRFARVSAERLIQVFAHQHVAPPPDAGLVRHAGGRSITPFGPEPSPRMHVAWRVGGLGRDRLFAQFLSVPAGKVGVARVPVLG